MPKHPVHLYALAGLTTLVLHVVILQYTVKYAWWLPWWTGATLLFPLAIYGYKYIFEHPSSIPGGRFALPALFFTAAGGTAAFIYPKANALRANMRGSDQDDCVRVVVDRLLSGHMDYHNAHSYFGTVNPCSTGLGEAILYLPFVPLGLLAFGSVIFLAICFGLLQRREVPAEGTVFIILIGSTLLTWNNVAVGSDFLFIGAAALMSVLALERAEIAKHRWTWLILAAVVCGLTASSRVAFFYLPAVLSLMTMRERPRASCCFLFSASSITAAFTLGPYVLDPQEFSPLHIVGKGTRILSPYIGFVILAFATAAIAVMALAAGGIRNGRLMLAISLGIPMAAVAISEANQGTVTAHYLAVAVPVFCAWLAQFCTEAERSAHQAHVTADGIKRDI